MNTHTFNEIKLGDTISFTKKITERESILFYELTGDDNPIHFNEEYASSTAFKKPIVHGFLYLSLFSTLAGVYLPGKYSLILSISSKFLLPVFKGDTLLVSGTVVEKIVYGKLIKLDLSIKNQINNQIVSGTMLVKVLK